jgi:hypothetical protein
MLSDESTPDPVAVARALSLIGTGPELRFDRVVGLIARYFDMPLGMVALVDGNRIWYKSRHGFDAAESEFPGSFTERVVTTERPHWVANALEDPVLAHSPWVNGERDRMVSYIGYPLRSSDSAVIGTLVLMDRAPREFTTDHVVQLGLVAVWIQEEMTRETESDRAAQVQRALLPTRHIAVRGFEVAGTLAPASSVSGDFFDWYEADDGLIFSLADVMGKGVGAAIIAATVRAVLRTADRVWGIETAVARAAELLGDDLSASGSFVTAIHCRLHASVSRIDYVDAGHGLTLHIASDGSWNRLAHYDLPLGTGLESTWGLHSISLAPGDTFVSFSDGVLDLFDGSLASMENVAQIFAEADSATVAVSTIRDLAKSAAGADDVTVVAVRRLPE